MTAMTSSMPPSFRRFGRDRRGVSAVEFAFIASAMIGLYLGCVEVSDGVVADRKVSLVAGALANLTARVATISAADMTNILDASSAIIAPYAADNLKMTISCLNIDANKNVTVKWSVTRNGTMEAGTMTIPSGLQVPGVLCRRLHHQRYAHAVGSYVYEPAHPAPVYDGKACT